MPTLYLMLGYPGAGKTTTALILSELTGAELLWADEDRLKMFGHPTFSHSENQKLYGILNDKMARLLESGKSVIYDTSFNSFADRKRMCDIANSAGGDCLLIWIQTDRNLAKQRATTNAAKQPTRPLAKVIGDMDEETFNRLCNKLEEPRSDEKYVKLDGTKITSDYVRQSLNSIL